MTAASGCCFAAGIAAPANLSDGELIQFEYLMDVPDPDLYAALTGNIPAAPDYAGGIFERIRSFRPGDRET